jgi:hypothetical protein
MKQKQHLIGKYGFNGLKDGDSLCRVSDVVSDVWRCLCKDVFNRTTEQACLVDWERDAFLPAIGAG